MKVYVLYKFIAVAALEVGQYSWLDYIVEISGDVVFDSTIKFEVFCEEIILLTVT